jgi:RNA polymerase sigma factor FliA
MDPPQVLSRVRAGLVLVDRVAQGAGGALGGAFELDDLVGYGRIGLLQAARAFDPKRGLSFEGYATIRIRGAIWDAARSEAGTRLVGCASEPMRTEPMPAEQPGVTALQRAWSLSEALAWPCPWATLGLVLEVTDHDERELAMIDADPEQELLNVELAASVVRWIRGLPYGQAELVRRHHFEDERLDRIGQDLGISKSWASRLHRRALKRLAWLARGIRRA